MGKGNVNSRRSRMARQASVLVHELGQTHSGPRCVRTAAGARNRDFPARSLEMYGGFVSVSVAAHNREFPAHSPEMYVWPFSLTAALAVRVETHRERLAPVGHDL